MSEWRTKAKSDWRFVAGAICPECHGLDRIVIESNGDRRRCIDCGFVEIRPEVVNQVPQTRVTRAAARRVETSAEPMRLIKE